VVSELLLILPILIVIAAVAGTAVVALWMLCLFALNRAGIALERHPLKSVRHFVRQQYPNESIGWLQLAATEPSRWVVGVFFGARLPPSYKFFAVARPSGEITELHDCSQYSPKQWR